MILQPWNKIQLKISKRAFPIYFYYYSHLLHQQTQFSISMLSTAAAADADAGRLTTTVVNYCGMDKKLVL